MCILHHQPLHKKGQQIFRYSERGVYNPYRHSKYFLKEKPSPRLKYAKEWPRTTTTCQQYHLETLFMTKLPNKLHLKKTLPLTFVCWQLEEPGPAQTYNYEIIFLYLDREIPSPWQPHDLYTVISLANVDTGIASCSWEATCGI